MLGAYVGIITSRGLEAFFPEHDHVVRFLTRRAYRGGKCRALCCWAVLADVAAHEVQIDLTLGNLEAALATLNRAALELGTIIPGNDFLPDYDLTVNWPAP